MRALTPELELGLAALARKVFGVRVFSCWAAQRFHPDAPFAVFDRARKAEPAEFLRIYTAERSGEPWQPHRSWADAGALVEHLEGRTFEVEIRVGASSCVRVWFADYEGNESCVAEQDGCATGPEAIYLAALEALSPAVEAARA